VERHAIATKSNLVPESVQSSWLLLPIDQPMPRRARPPLESTSSGFTMEIPPHRSWPSSQSSTCLEKRSTLKSAQQAISTQSTL
jgi:hypothetical protein